MAEEFFDCQETIMTPSYDYRQQSRCLGKVKWYKPKKGFGFITRDDNGESIFVHQKSIAKKNPNHIVESLCDGEEVEFNMMAADVTGIGRKPVKGSPCVSLIPIRTRNFIFPQNEYKYERSYERAEKSRIPRYSPIFRNMEYQK
ncbi:hypothetical protein PVAND_016994 [Polypedilum vanderplanki]|uniref:CSD domain-containing protein n=1 Tax=Polypedilum vanderplanki TaxID=319348 RepID=A0A9J6BGT6_POLVA|nr:hypothetical protein PVAND_016994 [Polypedilum vanderplanki]